MAASLLRYDLRKLLIFFSCKIFTDFKFYSNYFGGDLVKNIYFQKNIIRFYIILKLYFKDFFL